MVASDNPEEIDWDVLTRRLQVAPTGQPADPAKIPYQETLFNRELSWLQFNDRVLSEAADPTVPPLERLRFAAIVSSNLDEFFMVRVAGLQNKAVREPEARTPDGMTAAHTYAQVREHVLRQKGRQAVVFKEIVEGLRQHGMRLDAEFGRITPLDKTILENLPELELVLRRSTQGLPHLASERLHIYVGFPGEFAIITIRDREARLLQMPGNRSHFVLLERWLAARADRLFKGKDVIEAFPFKVIREADLRYRPDELETLEEQIREAVGRRARAKVVRLEVDASSYSEGALFLATGLRLDSGSLYRFNLPLDLRALADIYQQKPKLRYPAVVPQTPAPLQRKERLFDIVRKHDVLLHHPYDSFDIVLNFIQLAAEDPQVTHIYHTLYRTGIRSQVMEALKTAAQNGKRVTVYIEIKARFDEQNNLRWAAELRSFGARVVRPMGRRKVHSKATQIIRVEDGKDISYLHLGTGNYHETTSRQYTDAGLLTSDETLGRDVSAFFSALIRHQEPADFAELLVAPINLHQKMASFIDGEIEIQRQGGRGHIIAKMNSLVDKDVIGKLYDASQAGVKVELLVRGICCLRPGIRGLSENICVVSIIDRFLEHSRIYYFRAGGKGKLYLSSADWMPRNFYNRFELAFPVKDEALKRYIRDVILNKALADNVKAWHLRADGTYFKPPLPAEDKQVRSQFQLEELAKKQYRGTVLENRIPLKAVAP
ncbi:MAG: polyphosphate kinase 1 [Elusimicrobiota bacterium]